MNGKLDCQLVIEMIGGTWDRWLEETPRSLMAPKGAGGYI